MASAIRCIGASLPLFVRVEGFLSVGKTPFSQQLAAELKGTLVSSDVFLLGETPDRPYRECLRLDALQTHVSRLQDQQRRIVFEGICSREILPPEAFGLGYVIYLKRLSFNNPETPVWHEGCWLGGEIPDKELHKSLHEYHRKFQPHENADLILEIPADGHSIHGPLL